MPQIEMYFSALLMEIIIKLFGSALHLTDFLANLNAVQYFLPFWLLTHLEISEQKNRNVKRAAAIAKIIQPAAAP